ncbi:hypothetical protein HZS_5944 [Henneguya salminicola]|nr:hypothetical protein HZS_5944 [Henneguya salminicola]
MNSFNACLLKKFYNSLGKKFAASLMQSKNHINHWDVFMWLKSFVDCIFKLLKKENSIPLEIITDALSTRRHKLKKTVGLELLKLIRTCQQ